MSASHKYAQIAANSDSQQANVHDADRHGPRVAWARMGRVIIRRSGARLTVRLSRPAVGVLVAALLMTSCGPGKKAVSVNGGPSRQASASPTAAGPAKPAIFAFYYLWWDRQHWLTRLGPDYPVGAIPNPLPATLDRSSCGAVTNYPGNQLTDVSQNLSYDQTNPATIAKDVQLASDSGLAGFLVNWIGTGAATQTSNDSNYDKRLGYVFDAVHQLNAHGHKFTLILNYQSSAKALSPLQFSNDFSYFLDRYGSDPALDHTYSSKPEVVMAGTWKYSDKVLASVSQEFRARMYLIGDEKPSSWNETRSQVLDGTSYYWSSQDPARNPSSFSALAAFADRVRQTPNPDGQPKTWLAPLTPGYNAMLLYRTQNCVARDDGATMRALFKGNVASRPDGWTLISWNEISEGSYIVPLTRYGDRYTQLLRSLAQSP